jgi:hypothetical protein
LRPHQQLSVVYGERAGADFHYRVGLAAIGNQTRTTLQ